MTLALHELFSMHPDLGQLDFVDWPKAGALALQRSGHVSPAQTDIHHDKVKSTANIEWLRQTPDSLKMIEPLDLTEAGAVAVALAYANCSAGWVASRRMRQGEFADYLLENTSGCSLALEISGTIDENPQTRLNTKLNQLARCTLEVDFRLAIVVAFNQLSITAGSL